MSTDMNESQMRERVRKQMHDYLKNHNITKKELMEVLERKCPSIKWKEGSYNVFLSNGTGSMQVVRTLHHFFASLSSSNMPTRANGSIGKEEHEEDDGGSRSQRLEDQNNSFVISELNIGLPLKDQTVPRIEEGLSNLFANGFPSDFCVVAESGSLYRSTGNIANSDYKYLVSRKMAYDGGSICLVWDSKRYECGTSNFKKNDPLSIDTKHHYETFYDKHLKKSFALFGCHLSLKNTQERVRQLESLIAQSEALSDRLDFSVCGGDFNISVSQLRPLLVRTRKTLNSSSCSGSNLMFVPHVEKPTTNGKKEAIDNVLSEKDGVLSEKAQFVGDEFNLNWEERPHFPIAVRFQCKE